MGGPLCGGDRSCSSKNVSFSSCPEAEWETWGSGGRGGAGARAEPWPVSGVVWRELLGRASLFGRLLLLVMSFSFCVCCFSSSAPAHNPNSNHSAGAVTKPGSLPPTPTPTPPPVQAGVSCHSSVLLPFPAGHMCSSALVYLEIHIHSAPGNPIVSIILSWWIILALTSVF